MIMEAVKVYTNVILGDKIVLNPPTRVCDPIVSRIGAIWKPCIRLRLLMVQWTKCVEPKSPGYKQGTDKKLIPVASEKPAGL